MFFLGSRKSLVTSNIGIPPQVVDSLRRLVENVSLQDQMRSLLFLLERNAANDESDPGEVGGELEAVLGSIPFIFDQASIEGLSVVQSSYVEQKGVLDEVLVDLST